MPFVSFAIAYLSAAALVGCSAGITSRANNPPNNPPSNPPPSQTPVSVTITPTSATLLLGQTQQFQATVSGSTNQVVTWEVNGETGGSTSSGTISSSGLYTAPEILPTSTVVSIVAISAADNSASASAAIALQDDIAVTISPSSVDVPQSGQQTFTAAVSSAGHPAAEIAWSVDGIAGGNTTVGTIVANAPAAATYTAPTDIPSPATVTVTATSVADGSKTASANVTIICALTSAISPPSAIVPLSATQAFSASFCLAQGASVDWDVNGVAGGNTALGTIVATGASTAIYSAPADLPKTNALTIHAIASGVTAGASSVSAAVTITSNVSVSISPAATTVAAFQRTTLTPIVSGTTDGAVSWFVDGLANGNSTIGEICISGSNPCEAPSGPLAGAVDFFAPASVPAANPVTIAAVSVADNSRSATSLVTITGPSGPVSVSISPAYIFLPPSSSQPDTQQFFANVAGTANTAVAWTVKSAITAQGCAASACGTIDSAGLYTAPNAAPSPNAITVTATSEADATKFATATVVISSGPTIQSIRPSSVMAGAVEGFPLIVRGVNFVAGAGNGASVILIDGVPRATSCTSAGQCAIALAASDVIAPGTLTLEVQNPGAPGPISNPVPFVIVPFDISNAAISLTSFAPAANNTDLIVTDPTTAAASSPINIQSAGAFTSSGACAVQASPLTVTRPTSGEESIKICIYGNGLDPTFTYAFTGPASAPNASDIAVTALPITGLFPGMIELDLQITSDTLPGVRSLFVTTINNDHAVASGILEVK